MTNPLDDEVYGDKRVEDENATLNGNPGKPQSDYQQYDDAQPPIDPSDFEGSDSAGTVVPGTVRPADPESEPS
ncbi:hypothetical protein [Jatrophihabitans sp.]|uniref:hypothetical protein n=1 Tax=Jatrophihabitans sp. TaxID=1932789 RepID=UPI002D11939E|nr:hypothetical protein [Jatrophihabitans sp.]